MKNGQVQREHIETLTMESFAVGTYQATEAFRRVAYHTAVYDTSFPKGDLLNGELVASVGPADDSRSIAIARLFAESPRMLRLLEGLEGEAIPEEYRTAIREIRVRLGRLS